MERKFETRADILAELEKAKREGRIQNGKKSSFSERLKYRKAMLKKKLLGL